MPLHRKGQRRYRGNDLFLGRLYVILGKGQNFCKNFKNKVSEKFKISSYSDQIWFLNIETERTEHKIMLNQEAYIGKLIEKYKMSDCTTLEPTLDVSSNLSKLDSPETGRKEYHDIKTFVFRGIKGCLNCLKLTT